MENARLVVLISNSACNRKVAADQSRALVLLDSRRIPYEIVDGVNPATKERRNKLFKICGVRGQYPQFFLKIGDSSTTYVGDWEAVEGINDNSGLPETILEANPSILTWDKVLNGGIVA